MVVHKERGNAAAAKREWRQRQKRVQA